MTISGEIAIGIVLVVIAIPYLFGALKESGRIHMPRRKSSAFRRYPTFPADGEE